MRFTRHAHQCTLYQHSSQLFFRQSVQEVLVAIFEGYHDVSWHLLRSPILNPLNFSAAICSVGP